MRIRTRFKIAVSNVIINNNRDINNIDIEIKIPNDDSVCGVCGDVIRCRSAEIAEADDVIGHRAGSVFFCRGNIIPTEQRPVAYVAERMCYRKWHRAAI